MPDKDQAAIKSAAALLRAAGWVVTPPAEARYGCHCELYTMPEGSEPDGCVLDQGRRQDCIYAARILHREECEYWRAWTPESIAAEWRARSSDEH